MDHINLFEVQCQAPGPYFWRRPRLLLFVFYMFNWLSALLIIYALHVCQSEVLCPTLDAVVPPFCLSHTPPPVFLPTLPPCLPLMASAHHCISLLKHLEEICPHANICCCCCCVRFNPSSSSPPRTNWSLGLPAVLADLPFCLPSPAPSPSLPLMLSFPV